MYTYTQKKRQSKWKTKNSHQITRNEKRKGRKKRHTNTNPEQLTKFVVGKKILFTDM